MIDDATFLRRYAANRDETAFAEVVRRNLPLVYSAALRRLRGDTHRAQDVAQAVFCALARDAHRVARHPVLSGWLYTATRNAVIDLVRAENRRRTREQEAQQMQQIDSEPAAPADWSALRPVLDSAMDELNERDREAVLLRFFQGRSFGEIAAVTGSTEDAARKRTDRALEKLRERLRPSGIASTSAALATLLANQTTAAAPAALLASVTGAALSTGAAATGLTTFITVTKLQAGIAATLMAAATVGLIVQQRTISRLRTTAASAQDLAAISPTNAAASKARGAEAARSRSSSAPTAAVAAGAPTTVHGELLAESTAALQHGKVPERYFALAAVLQKLSAENWREVLQAFQDERKRTGLGHPEVFEIFVRRAGEVAGKDVVTSFLKAGWGGDANEAMIGWASKNPTDALQWLGREADTETRHRVMGATIRGLALTEPDLAVKLLEDQPAKERVKYVHELVTSMLRSVGLDGAQRLVEGMVTHATDAGQLKEDYLKYVFADYSVKRIAQSAASGTLDETVRWLSPHIGQPYVHHQVVAELTSELASQNIPQTLRWLEGVNSTLLAAGDDSTAGYRVLLDVWKQKEGAAVVENWLQANTSHPHYDHLAWQYAALVVDQDPAKALRWAKTIKDPAIKRSVVEALGKRLPREKS